MYDSRYAGRRERENCSKALSGKSPAIFLRTQSERSVRELSSNSLERILVRILCALAVIVPV